MKRIEAAALTAAILTGVSLAEYFDERSKLTPIWSYSSNPPYPADWDRYARVLLDPLMKVVAGGMMAHGWDWMEIPEKPDYKGIWVDPSKNRLIKYLEPEAPSLLHFMLAHSVFGMSDVYTLGIDWRGLDVSERVGGYHYAFQAEGQDSIIRSRIVIPTDETIRLLIGAGKLRVLALDQENNELPAIVRGPYQRFDPRVSDLRQS